MTDLGLFPQVWESSAATITWESNTLSNIIALIFGLVSVASLVVACVTYRSAASIDKKIKLLQGSAIDKSHFINNKDSLIKLLDHIHTALISQGRCSKENRRKLKALLESILLYENIFGQDDVSCVKANINKVNEFLANNDARDEKMVAELLSVTSETKRILLRGEHLL